MKPLFLLAIVTSLFLNSCGFHLRGASGFQFSSAYVHSVAANKIAANVQLNLIEEKVNITPTADQAQIVIHLSDEVVDRRILSVSSVTGKQEEFELSYQVEMEVKRADGTLLLQKQKISLLRDYLFDEKSILAMWSEDEILRQEMFDDIVAQIMRRLQILKSEQLVLTQLKFEGLKPKYMTGEQVAVDLVETTARAFPVDLWLTLTTNKETWFIIPSQKQGQNWQLIQAAQPLQTNIPVEKTRHAILDFIVAANLTGKYKLLAVYTKTGDNLDLENLQFAIRSNMVESELVFSN